jgi:hypothetical protein
MIGIAAASVAAAALPATADANPDVCARSVIQRALIDAGKLTQQDVANGEVVDLVRCGDVTADGPRDAVFTVASGGTAGDTRFGVLKGRANGSAGKLVLYRSGYKVGISRHSRRAFDVLQPHYDANDPNCCPSSFRMRRYTWTGTRFKAGRTKKLQSAPARFYRP